ncbi:LLM class flavin-dependent oxidoreductase [Micromonospora sp. WMMA1363]|uniref:LLM class flavin-dependent oxidoreductase n=1 Tax=Micromonospora sp. WMMA1363 TaxID=3053985 RepID=UPI00259C8B36|nr:LLM class flavin-dependent oxidoreductase [Micromonospora sp. WMMA1363]MDM4718634.1 LLM class flavin-dependent oxidoreductase [Micromonospora sp. WMMA1363]
MPLHLHWFLPSHGDGREVAKTPDGAPAQAVRRAPEIDYLGQVAGAADRLGFDSVLVPTGLFCEDPWLASAALARHTHRLRFMVAVRPGFLAPTVAAQMAATLQRLSGGRLLLNIVAGGDRDEQLRYGDWLDHDQRYARADEFLDVLSRAWTGDPYDFDGVHYRIRAGRLTRGHPVRPTVFLGGSSPAAHEVAARHADVYLAWGEPPEPLGALVKQVRDRADAQGRELSYGSRFHVISRDTADEAWQVARRLVDRMHPDTIAAAQQRFRKTESEGQRRMAALHRGHTDDLEVHPNVWAGYGLVRPGAGLALVGSHTEVADRIEEYHSSGLDHLILSGQPHLEEAYTFGEGVLPILRRRGLLAEPEGDR